MEHSHLPFLVVGAGLGGLSVASRLIDRGVPVVVMDNGINHSSRVAAGMINPLVFRRMNRSWRLDACMAALQEFYPGLETKTEARFFHPVLIRRMFSNEHERELWLSKQELPEYAAYMAKVTPEDDAFTGAINNFGSGRVLSAAYVKTSVFLDATTAYVEENAILLNETFDYEKLDGNTYNGTAYRGIVFCQGYLGVGNPFFDHLPLQQTMGETLVIRAQTIPEDQSVNRKCFILPMGNQQFKVGSTYNWDCAVPEISEKGRQEILEKVAYLTNETVEVIDQEAGVRPTSPDRRPMIGQHPENPHLYIFNALGTKGYLLAPLMSKEFADFLLDGAELAPEVRITRFKRAL